MSTLIRYKNGDIDIARVGASVRRTPADRQITVLQRSKHLITVVICSRIVLVCAKEKFHRSFSLTKLLFAGAVIGMAITFFAQRTTMLARVELIRSTHGLDDLPFVVLGCHFKRISKSSKNLINRGFC